MTRRFTRILAALALLVTLAIPMGMKGQTSVTWPGTTALPSMATAVANDQNVTIMVSSTNTYTNPIRIYANTTVTINASNNAKILSVAYEASSTGNYVTNAQNATVDPEVAPTVNGKIVTWTYAESENVTTFTFTPSAQTRSNGITITYMIPGANPTCATPTFDPAAGTYTEAQNVSISCATEGAIIYYTTNGDEPTTNSMVYTAAIYVSSDMTIKAMATAEGYDNSAIATAEYAFITLEHAGTLEDPYTVADARAAIDANAGTQGVYATGIVSAIPTAWNSQYSNITFDFVDNAGDTDVLEAYHCASGTGVDASQVAVGDVVVVYGNLTKYGSTYEFNSGCQLVSLTHPVITTPVVTVTPNTINAPAEGADGTLALTYENIEEFISFDYYFCDANGNELEDTDPDYPGDWIYAEINEPGEEENYTLSYIIDANDGEARTAYVKVYTFDDNLEEVYAIVTVNQTAYEAPNVTWNLSIDETATATEDEMTWTSDYATMAVEKGTSSTNTNNYYPGTSGHNYTSTRFYTGSVLTIAPVVGYAITSVEFTATTTGYASALMNSTWTNATASAEGTTVTITPSSGSGAIQATIGATCGFTQVKVYYEQHQAETYDLTISLNENIPFIFVFDANDQNNPLIEDGAAGTVQVLEGTSILVSPDVAEGYVLETLMVNNENVISQLDESGAYTFEMPAENVTISATAVEDVPPTPGNMYVKVTSTNDLTSGQYLIVYEEGNVAFDGGLKTLDAVSNTIGVTIQDDEIAVTTETAAAEFTIDMAAGTIKSASGYYIGRTTNSNGMNSSTTETYTNTITIDEGYNAVITSSANPTLRYNDASNQTRFRYYGSGQKAIQLYKKVEPTPAGIPMVIAANQWYLISSPVGTINLGTSQQPTNNVGNLTTGTYGLYSFDQTGGNDGKEWRNYKAGAFSQLEAGKGYLYINQEGCILTFTGTAYSTPDGSATFPIDYYTSNPTTSFHGLNLVGNPYAQSATIDHDYYIMNADGTDLAAYTSDDIVPAMQGVFVQATEEGENVTFTPNQSTTGGKGIEINLSQNRGTIVDRAIVRFGEGSQLSKVQLFENSTKLYIPQNGKDYAIVSTEAQGELPVNFRASENGTYTLSMDVENMDMNYLHLIDNMTGMDIDLLQTPSYTFNATTRDYESRFRLVFAGNNANADSDNFAFFSNGNLIINNEGNATLQVVDLTGRILSSETVNGSVSKTINAVPGIYMLRLINGDNVNVQKIVVR